LTFFPEFLINMSEYLSTTTAIIEQAQTLEKTLPIRNEACRSLFFFHENPTPKVCLFFHGFTAGPYQFQPIAQALFAAGYNVLVPLQPGHGIAGSWDSGNPPPLPTESEVYQEFALSWLEVAQNLGDEIIVGGLSSGGTLAAWLSVEHPQEVAKALIFAPYLGGNNELVDFAVEILPIYYEWPNKDNPGNNGYQGFRFPALRLFLGMGEYILEKIKDIQPSPMFIISSESDKAVDVKEINTLFASLVKQQPKSWYYRFDQVFEIPHTMMTEVEGNKYQNLLITIAQAYLESEITWDELLKVGYYMLQGRTFEKAAQELNLQERVSPEISVLLAIMDNREVIKRVGSRE